MLNKSTISSSKITTQQKPSTSDAQLSFWPPSAAAVDALVLKLKAKDGDSEANWEKIILNFKKEIQQDEQLNYTQSSGNGEGDGGERREKVRAKFSVPLSRKEMEKDFEDMGERRLPRKPKKRPRVIQNHLDTLFPGLWLTEIHADLYRVSETKKLTHPEITLGTSVQPKSTKFRLSH